MADRFRANGIGWVGIVRDQFHWLDHKPPRTEDAEWFRVQMARSLDWLLGDWHPWASDPGVLYQIDRNFRGARLYRIVASALSQANEHALIHFTTPDGQLTKGRCSIRFLGEDEYHEDSIGTAGASAARGITCKFCSNEPGYYAGLNDPDK